MHLRTTASSLMLRHERSLTAAGTLVRATFADCRRLSPKFSAAHLFAANYGEEWRTTAHIGENVMLSCVNKRFI